MLKRYLLGACLAGCFAASSAALAADQPAAPAIDAPRAAPLPDTSLRIGSLKGERQ